MNCWSEMSLPWPTTEIWDEKWRGMFNEQRGALQTWNRCKVGCEVFLRSVVLEFFLLLFNLYFTICPAGHLVNLSSLIAK